MPLYTDIASLSQTPASNAADGTTDAPSTIDNNMNLLASFIAQLRDGVGFTIPLSSQNRLINGNFTVNQRAKSGTVVLAAGQYGHDRWKAGAAGCTYTFIQSGVDVVITISLGSLQQVIEGVNVEGGSYCLSWFGTAQGKIGGGSYGASGVTASGVSANTNLVVEFGAGTLSRVQLEPGSSASPFERRSFSDELSRAQRYYEAGSGAIGGYAAASIGAFQWVPFKVSKRAAPTLAYNSLQAVNVSVFDARSANFQGLEWYCELTATGGFIWRGNWTADCEI